MILSPHFLPFFLYFLISQVCFILIIRLRFEFEVRGVVQNKTCSTKSRRPALRGSDLPKLSSPFSTLLIGQIIFVLKFGFAPGTPGLTTADTRQVKILHQSTYRPKHSINSLPLKYTV